MGHRPFTVRVAENCWLTDPAFAPPVAPATVAVDAAAGAAAAAALPVAPAEAANDDEETRDSSFSALSLSTRDAPLRCAPVAPLTLAAAEPVDKAPGFVDTCPRLRCVWPPAAVAAAVATARALAALAAFVFAPSLRAETGEKIGEMAGDGGRRLRRGRRPIEA